MTSPWGSRRAVRDDDGVAIVEAAFALPILFMFIMALIDLGMWSYNSNQAANAARDGARAGIIDFQEADDPTSDDWQTIVDAVEAHLPGRSIDEDAIEISCVEPDDQPITGGCWNARVDEDRIRVEVAWSWDLLTPIAGLIGVDSGASTGTATMAIVGRPVAGTPPVVQPPPDDGVEPPPDTEPEPDPTPCTVTEILVSQPNGTAPRMYSGKISDLEISYTTNAVDLCEGLAVQLTTPEPDEKVVSAVCKVCEEVANHVWDYSSNAGYWKAGSAWVRIFNGSVDVSAPFVVNGS